MVNHESDAGDDLRFDAQTNHTVGPTIKRKKEKNLDTKKS